MTFLPQHRLHAVIRRWVILVIAAQGLITASLLVMPVLGGPNIAGIQGMPTLAVGGGVAFVAAIVTPLMLRNVRRWSSSLHLLHAAIKRLASGAEPKPMPVGGEDEVAFLAVAFNDMAGRLLASRHALVEANEELEHRVIVRTEELSVANSELDRKNAELSQLTETALRFTDDVAHEFRTPLTVIQEFASIITDGIGGDVTEQQTEYLEYITRASKELANLVDDFLDSSRLRAGTLRVDRRRHTVEAILDAGWPMLASRAKESKITLERQIDPDVPAVMADLDKARRTLINLVVNAIKFSPPGASVIVSARRTPNGHAEIQVSDHGRGMSPEELSTLFHRFNQCSEGQRSSCKGFGLGLSIVRDLVTTNLGEVSVISAPGQGSTFSFTLPTADPDGYVRKYIDHVIRRNPDAQLTILRADRAGETVDVNGLQAFLSSATRPSALLLPAADERSILIVDEFADPSDWIREMTEQDNPARKSRGAVTSGALRIVNLGTFNLADAAHAIHSPLHLSSTTKEYSCA